MKIFFGFILFVGCVFADIGYSQVTAPLSKPQSDSARTGNERNKTVKEPENVIESRSDCVKITDYNFVGDELNVTLKNNCCRKILSSIVKQGFARSMLSYFPIEPEKEKKHKVYLGGIGADRAFILEAVIFDNADGSGNAESVKTLQAIYYFSRIELEKILSFIVPHIENPNGNVSQILQSIKRNVETLPNEFFDSRQFNIGGATLFSGKSTYYGRIIEIENNKNGKDIKFVIEELKKLQKDLIATIATYPKFPD